jgi:hypothetical protein
MHTTYALEGLFILCGSILGQGIEIVDRIMTAVMI